MVNPALHALNRFGLGARIGEPRRIASDPRGWLEEQLDAVRSPDAPPPAATSAEIGALLGEHRTRRRGNDREAASVLRSKLQRIAEAEVLAGLAHRVASRRPFVERLVGFWSNHLCVSMAGGFVVAPFAGGYERDAIRPFVLGRYEEMVLASARHPAMLLYLDNAQSIGPASPVGRRTGRGGIVRGLNENYARELLELHTLGVDGGYTQADVEALARILTGWSIGRARPGEEPGVFAFRAAMHEPGAKTLLGVRYAEGGIEEGEAAIRALCRHPATARFVAAKLVRHFVADEPPSRAIATVADSFIRSDGDLREVARTVIHLDSAWDPVHRKFRTPQDWLIAALRALGARDAHASLGRVLRQLRHPVWAPPAPKGFGDTTREWADPDALMNRAELARTIAERLDGAGPEPVDLLEVAQADDPLSTLLADRSIARDERIALALAGPAFQWR